MNSILILNNIEDLHKIKFSPKTKIILKEYNLNLHFKFAKNKIYYHNYCNFNKILKKNKINEIYLEYKNINQYFKNILIYNKKKISNINIIFYKEDFINYSENFKSTDKIGKNVLIWNCGIKKKSSLKIFNFFPQILRIEFTINWPPFSKWKVLSGINKLYDNHKNTCSINENNKKFSYYLKPFENKKIIFNYRKFFFFKDDQRNLNFALKNCKIFYLKQKLLKKKINQKLNFIKDYKAQTAQFFLKKIKIKKNNNFDYCIIKFKK